MVNTCYAPRDLGVHISFLVPRLDGKACSRLNALFLSAYDVRSLRGIVSTLTSRFCIPHLEGELLNGIVDQNDERTETQIAIHEDGHNTMIIHSQKRLQHFDEQVTIERELRRTRIYR